VIVIARRRIAVCRNTSQNMTLNKTIVWGHHFCYIYPVEKTIRLSCVCSKEFEVKRVVYTINRLDWYLNNKYSIESLSFPKNFDPNKLASISGQDMVAAVEKEYDPDKFISVIGSLNQLYKPYEVKLVKFVENLNLPVITDITVNLTIYGIAGSYSVPNQIIINISKFYGIGLLRNVLHEIIHLHIQHLIDKYKVGQWEKETVVNLLFATAFPDIYKKNNVPPINTEKIEAVYKANFPNIEKIISLI